MDYYDIVMDSCSIDEKLSQRLGYKKIFSMGKDIKLANLNDPKVRGASAGIIMGEDKNKLLTFARGDVKAVIVTDFRIDKKLMAHMAENDIVLCIPVSAITFNYGLSRSRAIYMLNTLFTYARKSDIEVSFITQASSEMYLASEMQLIELAMLVGADEKYARHSISEVNKGLME